MTDRGPVTRCPIPGCIAVGHWTNHADLCPTHRTTERR